ncbi:MAG: acyltransferase [Bdellovibrionaceae bacterium]|nr:acyltransferase [Pseudobdellovibrionaceae bacterium]
MDKVSMVSKYIIGLIYFVFGLSFFFVTPPPPDESIAPFMTGLMSTGYFFPFLKVTETVCGALVIAGFFVPLALVILAPITIQIFLFHAVMTPGITNLIIPIAMIVLHVLAARNYWSVYQPLLKPKTK